MCLRVSRTRMFVFGRRKSFLLIQTNCLFTRKTFLYWYKLFIDCEKNYDRVPAVAPCNSAATQTQLLWRRFVPNQVSDWMNEPDKREGQTERAMKLIKSVSQVTWINVDWETLISACTQRTEWQISKLRARLAPFFVITSITHSIQLTTYRNRCRYSMNNAYTHIIQVVERKHLNDGVSVSPSTQTRNSVPAFAFISSLNSVDKSQQQQHNWR